ncbi:MAG: YicC family protein [Bacteroidetes bacterium]|nr:MAG: YicC family protein [Bacteroidota bacterium]
MLKSMTGYGMGNTKDGSYEINTEIKSLNSKFADISVRIPSQWSSLELVIRKQLADALVRGKISVSVEVINSSDDVSTLFDEQLLKQYYKQFKKVADDLNNKDSDLFSLAMHAPNVIKVREDVIDTDISIAIKDSVSQAIGNCDEFRQQEGAELSDKLKMYIDTISTLLQKIDPYDEQRIKKVEEKLRAGLESNKNLVDVDNNRFEQELIYYIEKFDINEEKVRLTNHLTYFIEVLEKEQANGKKLGFISQEIGREINTIGSKANNADIQRIVVEMKEELEKIKEQALNVL